MYQKFCKKKQQQVAQLTDQNLMKYAQMFRPTLVLTSARLNDTELLLLLQFCKTKERTRRRKCKHDLQHTGSTMTSKQRSCCATFQHWKQHWQFAGNFIKPSLRNSCWQNKFVIAIGKTNDCPDYF